MVQRNQIRLQIKPPGISQANVLFLLLRTIYNRLDRRRQNERRYQKRDRLHFALKDVKWSSSKQEIHHLAEEEQIRLKIKNQHHEYETVKSRNKQLKKDCRQLTEECKSMMKALGYIAGNESKPIQSGNEEQRQTNLAKINTKYY